MVSPTSRTTSPLNPARQPYYDSPFRVEDGDGYASRNDSSLSVSSGSNEHERSGIQHQHPLREGMVGEDFGLYSHRGLGDSRMSSAHSSLSSSFPPNRSVYTPRQRSYTDRSKPPGSSSPRAGLWTHKDTLKDLRLHDDNLDSYQGSKFSKRGCVNLSVLMVLVFGLIALFAGYPIISFFRIPAWKTSYFGAYNVGGINATGQVPKIHGLPTLIDADTPKSAYHRTGVDGSPYTLMFSDEFNVEGRTFWPGDDPYWEAVDLHYWQTGDKEWYDPEAIVTEGGNLVITLSQEPWRDLNFRSGMLQSWNAFCFTGGHIEVSVSLPGNPLIAGFWPGIWTLGNLARPGYGATTDGTWPYSYDSCDVGTMPNQTNNEGTLPVAALDGKSKFNNNDDVVQLSYLPGQRLSSCTCPGEDHPGPSPNVGRGAPEIDILEGQIAWRDDDLFGAVSQSSQVAPFNAAYGYTNSTPMTTVNNHLITYLNEYEGGPFQQAVSGVTRTNQQAYQETGRQFSTYAYENDPSPEDPSKGYTSWFVDDKVTWTITAASLGPDPETEIGPRLISIEPMSIILNLGMSDGFQPVNWKDTVFPGKMLVDYVRVYQRTDSPNIGCDPPARPTADYIARHAPAYHNPNFTTFAQAGYSFPKNSFAEVC